MDRRDFLKTLGAGAVAAVAIALPSLPAEAQRSLPPHSGIVLHHTAFDMSHRQWSYRYRNDPGTFLVAMPDGSVQRA